MPEPTINGTAHAPGDEASGSTPFELLRAVKEVQERRISVWREYDDAFDTFLSPTSTSGPVNGSQNPTPTPIDHEVDAEGSNGVANGGRGCAGCSTATVPLTEELLAQILQITTQALIECGHRLRTIQTELAHSSAPQLATLADRIQTRENALLRATVQRDQLRKSVLKPNTDSPAQTDEDEARQSIASLDAQVQQTKADLADLMQEVYAEIVELQLDA
jgi:hypothetical protein